ncbi:cytochrome c oxidase accessory protein CcoG [Candidatus Albibeggiatoa sp. nov. NOAA]|uniref:cytochrome c oxidase accessory protein CcoG n=1 Tax=Candidatus Albibeggiatoa sp. nov. NOAA TaxID=3162724 RepID=UPI0032F7CD90|nr:cytochrome c oxidase accessory protein CcoG [Thiotrichaceae bacterium]
MDEQKIPLKDVEQSLYSKREKIYPRIVLGTFTRLKALSGIILLGIFYGFPWLQWGDRQAVLFDLPARQFHVFGLSFWPQDFIYLAFLLIIAAMSLFFFTTLAGRLWCGYACPQTIWTDAFLWMERLVEGDRPQQMKLDKAPMSFRKFRIKFTKQFIWIAFALFTGFTFVGFFTPIRELWDATLTFNLSGWETFWLFFYGFATYGNAGWMREQVCTYMCPYARFQSAMFDKDTMIIAYDEKRGEPRGSRKRNEDPDEKGLGDCINCTLCVQVCPTGIDIRDGLQYQCISCSACIDVCDDVMDKMGYKRGLVRYTTEHALQGEKTHIFRPRIFIYATILLVLLAGLGYSISQRVGIELDVLRDRSALYKETAEGNIKNIYTLKITNKDSQPHAYELTVSGIEGVQVLKPDSIIVDSGQVQNVSVSLVATPEQLQARSAEVMFTLTSTDDETLTITEDARFLSPMKR